MKIGEAAKHLDCTPATIRNYIKRYSDYLSPDATSKHRKNFTDKDISTLLKIKNLLDQGYKYKEIPALLDDVSLDDVIPEILDTHEQVNTYDEPIPQERALELPEVFEFIQQALDSRDEQHQREITAKDETIALLRAELERERLPWWKKIF